MSMSLLTSIGSIQPSQSEASLAPLACNLAISEGLWKEV